MTELEKLYQEQLEQHIKSLTLSLDDMTDEIAFTKYKINHLGTCLERLYKGRVSVEEQLELAIKQRGEK